MLKILGMFGEAGWEFIQICYFFQNETYHGCGVTDAHGTNVVSILKKSALECCKNWDWGLGVGECLEGGGAGWGPLSSPEE